jgi:hypothetical protein
MYPIEGSTTHQPEKKNIVNESNTLFLDDLLHGLIPLNVLGAHIHKRYESDPVKTGRKRVKSASWPVRR